MNHLAPTYSVQVDRDRHELHFVTSGLFDAAKMEECVQEIGRQVAPLLSKGQKIRALGDLSEFVTQTRDVAEKMQKTLVDAQKFGVERTAIFITSSLVALQYKRLSTGLPIKIFDNRSDALLWLRAD